MPRGTDPAAMGPHSHSRTIGASGPSLLILMGHTSTTLFATRPFSIYKAMPHYPFFGAWPVRCENYEIESDGKNALIEEIDIVVAKIERGSARGTIGN